jgi:hypothetical protein
MTPIARDGGSKCIVASINEAAGHVLALLGGWFTFSGL